MPTKTSPSPAFFSCTACGAAIVLKDASKEYGAVCPNCEREVWATVFPARFVQEAPSRPESLDSADQSSCFFHPQKKAVVPCDGCGRFLCALCQMEFSGRNLCVNCLAAGHRKGSIPDLQNHRTLYDTLALALSTAPALLFWPTLFGAPAALFVTFRYWKAPASLVRRTRIRFYLAILFAMLQIAGWVAIVMLLIRSRR